LRFLAATQFYKGGHYGKALELASAIEAGKLPAATRRLLPRFLEDVRDRASPGYESRMSQRLQTLWTARDHAGILSMLQEHPYAVSVANLAFLRAVCCEAMGKYRPAVLFFADASRWAPDNPAVLAALAPLLLQLLSEGRLQEAGVYVQAQLELFPNVVSHAIASLLCYRRAGQAEGKTRMGLFEEQMRYFDQAREEYTRLPPAQQSYPQIKVVLEWAYEDAAFALYLSGDQKAAREMCNSAIAFASTSPNGWTTLGLITAGNPESVDAFKKAAEHGDPSYVPYTALAYDALMREDFQEGLDWSRQALARKERLPEVVESLLYQWWAICLIHLNGSRDEIQALLEKALEIAPDNEFARENQRRFQAARASALPRDGWKIAAWQLTTDGLIRDRESVLFQGDHSSDRVPSRLAGVA
jgi:tetratricopeptide (TPR) repeat protein